MHSPLTGDCDVLSILQRVANDEDLASPGAVVLNRDRVDDDATLVAFRYLWFAKSLDVSIVDILYLDKDISVS